MNLRDFGHPGFPKGERSGLLTLHRDDFRLAVRSRLKYARPMKTEKYHLYVLLLVIFTRRAFAGCQTSNSASGTSMAATSKNAGHLTVRRAAKFGSRMALMFP